MTRQLDIERILDGFMADGSEQLADHVLEAALTDIDNTQQRWSWWPTWRFPRMSTYAKTAIAAAAVLVVLTLAYKLLPGSGPAAVPTPSPTGTPLVLMTGGGVELDAGTYSLAGFPVGVTFELPEGWYSCSASAVEQGVCYEPGGGQPGIGVSFLIVVGVVADPCSPGEELLSPPVGESVDDLVAAISGLDGFGATTPTDITIDGFTGKEFTITAPPYPACDLKTWATANRTNGVAAGEANIVRILDVSGTRVLISGAYDPGDPAAIGRVAALEQVLASVHVTP